MRDHCHYTGKYRGAAHSICNLRYKIPKEIPVVFHNGSTYDYHFIIKQLAKEHDNGKTTTYKLKFIDSYRFMQDSLSNLVDNLSNINNKEPDNKFIDGMRWIHYHSLLIKYHRSIEVSQSAKKELENKFIDNMRSMMTSLSQSINKIAEIDRKISQIDKKEPDKKFIDSMRSMMTSLLLSIDKISEIDKKNHVN